ncbi:MAG: ribonuclease P protein component [Omnitrophica bacterium RIFCSPHIGHO2_02_FULL_46_11]|nr:MAG: ribonuclease P protein component [Omnitrophica bacterium RIFCSPHIGHO2_02_FULL_46_11]OGW87446.1 MAG: ribonuclease P protein component [Omnitrophica bacterium RIFCSPLOWO2_01_FULL_45_10b]
MTASRTSFPRTERIKQAADFRTILKYAHVFRESGVALYCSQIPAQDKSRLGIVVSRRVLKNAVDRNRVKRVTREFFRLNKTNFRSNFDLVVRIIESGKSFKNNNLREVLNRLFKRAGVLNCAE